MKDIEQFQSTVITSLSTPSVNWSYRDLDSATDKGCSVCGDSLSLGIPGEVQFGKDATLPIHKECHLAREGLSSEACRLSMIGFSFLIRASMNPRGWEKKFLNEFVKQHGSGIGSYLIGHGIPWWNRSSGFKTLEDLVRWSRWCFIYERDPGKFTSVGKDIPHWNEDHETWQEYISCNHKEKKYGTFYKALYKKPRTKRGKTPKCDMEILMLTSGRCGFCFDKIQNDGCRSQFSCESDHIFPDSKGGTHNLENIQPLHSYCNGKKSSISGGHAPLGWMLGRFALNLLTTRDALLQWKSLASKAADSTKILRI